MRVKTSLSVNMVIPEKQDNPNPSSIQREKKEGKEVSDDSDEDASPSNIQFQQAKQEE